MKLTDEEKRIKIAEACGWTRIPAENVGTTARLFYGDIWWRDAENNTIASADQLPDYLNDLNAMHEAEKLCIRGKHDGVYRSYLAQPARDFDEANGNCLGEGAYVDCCTYATAAERAEAFGRTLNLWTE